MSDEDATLTLNCDDSTASAFGNIQYFARREFLFSSPNGDITVASTAGVHDIYFEAHRILGTQSDSKLTASGVTQFFSDVGKDVVISSATDNSMSARSWDVEGENVVIQASSDVIVSAVEDLTFEAHPVGSTACTLLQPDAMLPPATCNFKTALQIEGSLVELEAEDALSMDTSVLEILAGGQLMMSSTAPMSVTAKRDFEVSTQRVDAKAATFAVNSAEGLRIGAVGGDSVEEDNLIMLADNTITQKSTGERVYINGGNISFGAGTGLQLQSSAYAFMEFDGSSSITGTGSAAFGGKEGYLDSYELQASATGVMHITAGSEAFFDVGLLSLNAESDLLLFADIGDITLISGGDIVSNSANEALVRADGSLRVNAKEVIEVRGAEVLAKGLSSVTLSSEDNINFRSTESTNNSLTLESTEAGSDIKMLAANGEIFLDAGASLSIATDIGDFTMTGGQVRTKSGFGSDTTLKSGDDLSFMTTNEPDQGSLLQLKGRNVMTTSDGPLSMEGGEILLFSGLDVILAGSSVTVIAPTDGVILTTPDFSASAINSASITGQGVRFTSGSDKDCFTQARTALNMFADEEIIVSGEGNMTMYSSLNFTVSSESDVRLTGIERLHAHAESSFLSSAEEDTKMISGGAFHITSGKADPYDVRVESASQWNAAASGEFRILSDGVGRDGCGISIYCEGDEDNRYSSKKNLNIDGESVRVNAVGRNTGNILFFASDSVFFHAEEGGIHFQVESDNANTEIAMKTGSEFGNIEHAAHAASLTYIGSNSVLVEAGTELALHGRRGVDVTTTEVGGDIDFKADSDINVAGLRGLNISAGTDVPFGSGNLQIEARSIFWTSDDEIVIGNVGPVRSQADPDAPAITYRGNTASFSTVNSHDISMAAYTDFNVKITGLYTFTTESGNLDVVSQTGALTANAAALNTGDTRISASDGPIVLNAGGSEGGVNIRAESWDIDADELSFTAKQARAEFTASTYTLESVGSIALQTLGKTGDISIGAKTTMTITSTGSREIPEDRIVMSGRYLQYETFGDLLSLSATGALSIGAASEPQLNVRASLGGFTMTSAGDMALKSDSDMNVFAGTSLEVSVDERMDIRSLGDVAFLTNSVADDDLKITAGTNLGDAGSVKVEGSLVAHQTATSWSITTADSLNIEATGNDFDEDYISFSSGDDTSVSSETDVIYTASDSILAELDVSASFYSFERVVIRNPTFTGVDEDTDQGSIYFYSATDITAKLNDATGTNDGISISTSDARAPITFLSKSTSDSTMRISGAANVGVTSTKGDVIIGAAKQEFGGTSRMILSPNVVDPSGSGATIDMTALGAFTASSVKSSTFTSAGDLFMSSTAFGGDVTFTANDFQLTTVTDMSFSNGLENGGTIALEGKIVGLENVAGTSADVNIDADKDFAVTVGQFISVSMSNQINLSSKDEFLISSKASNPNAVLFNSDNADKGTILMRTSGQDSSLNVNAGKSFSISTGAFAGLDDILLIGSNGVALNSKQTAQISAVNGNINYASTQGSVIFQSLSDSRSNLEFDSLQAGLTFKSFGQTAAQDYGMAIDAVNAIDIDVSQDFFLSASEGIEFVEIEDEFKLVSTGGAVETVFDASGYQTGLRIVSQDRVRLNAKEVKLMAGNAFRATAVKMDIDTSKAIILQSPGILLETTEEAVGSDVALFVSDGLISNTEAGRSTSFLAQAEDIALTTNFGVPLNFQSTITPAPVDNAETIVLRARTGDIRADTTGIGGQATIGHVTDNLYFKAGRAINIAAKDGEIMTNRLEVHSGRDLMFRDAFERMTFTSQLLHVHTSEAEANADINMRFLVDGVFSSVKDLRLIAHGDDGDIEFRSDSEPITGVAPARDQVPKILFKSILDLSVNAENGVQIVANEVNDGGQYVPAPVVFPFAFAGVHTAFLQAANALAINTHENFKDIYMVGDRSSSIVTTPGVGAADFIAVTEWASTLGFFEQTPKPVQWVGTQSLEVCAYQPRLNDNPITAVGIFCGLQGASTEAEGYNEHGTDNDLRNPSRSVTYHAALQVLSDQTRRIQLALADIGLINYPQQNPDDGLGVICLFPQA